jgi:acyl-CoA thioesterase II
MSDDPILLSVLDIEQLDRDLFRARARTDGIPRLSLYGGQVAAQLLRAAGLTVPEGRHPHSLHGYFLRPGKTDRDVLLHVDRDRDGGSFSARHGRAVQDGEVIFSMVASFHEAQPSPTYDGVPTRSGPDAETLKSAHGVLALDVREIVPTRVRNRQVRHSDRFWIRVPGSLGDDPLVHACAITYASDLGSGFGQVDIQGLAPGGPSIDHSLWFHDPIRADEWMLCELWPLKASGSRGLYHGSLRSADGRLGASFAQEMLLREHDYDDATLARLEEFFGTDNA